MGLESRGSAGPYFYRKVREGGRVRSVYAGKRELALLFGALVRDDRAEKHREAPEESPESAALVAQVEGYCEGVGTIVRSHLEANGYRRHKRGEWRRARG